MKKLLLAAWLSSMAVLAGTARADDGSASGPWLVRVGIADLDNMNGLDLSVAGQPVPGAALHWKPIYTPIAEIGYSFVEDWSAVLTVGFPPSFGAYAGGSIASYGKLESVTFGPTALTIQYQPFHTGFFRPYVGVGGSYMIIFRTSAATVQNPGLSNDLAPAFEVGSDFAVSEDYGLFAEVKKAFLQSDTTGTIGGYPLTGKANLDPWVFSTGVTLHF